MPTPRIDGIDTSHYQALTPAPLPALTFAMHKASEGVSYQDPTLSMFTMRYRTSKQVAHVGFYHFLRSDSSAVSQFVNFSKAITSVGGLHDGEFVCLDWERDSTGRIADPQAVEAWVSLAQQAWGAHKVAVYSSPVVTGFNTWRFRNPTVALFLPNYRTSPLMPGNGWAAAKTHNATAWQWSSTQQASGIAGRVDVNHVFDPAWFARLSKPKPAPITLPTPTLKLGFPRTKSAQVTNLQGIMRFWHWYGGIAHGTFDRATAEGVKAMQRSLKVTVDGIYGPETAKALLAFLRLMQTLAASK